MDEIKLKPCPFCGCEMAIDAVPNYDMKSKMYFIVGKPEHAKDCMIGALATPRYTNLKILAAFWNRRADNG